MAATRWHSLRRHSPRRHSAPVLGVVLESKDARTPVAAASSFLLFSAQKTTIAPGSKQVVPLDVTLSLPPGMQAAVVSLWSQNAPTAVESMMLDPDVPLALTVRNKSPSSSITVLKGVPVAQLIPVMCIEPPRAFTIMTSPRLCCGAML